MEDALSSEERQAIDDMPLESLRDYRKYNEEARRLNKKLGVCRYKVKPCPEVLHPKERIVFGRNDQPSNPLPVCISDEVIDFKKTLIPGKEYELPKYVISWLSKLGNPVWKWVEKADGARETHVDHYDPRFAIRTIYAD